VPIGNFAKNRRTGNSRQIVIPSGPASDRPRDGLPIFGSFRFNTTVGNLEVFDGTQWKYLAVAGLTNVSVDTFTGDGSTTVFGSMTNAVDNETDILVFVGGVYQIPDTNYTVDGSYDITFTAAPPNNVPVNIIHNLNSTVV
jgi:hypothetical protein